jgi:hypothetical protein
MESESGHVRDVCGALYYRRLLHCAIAVMSRWIKQEGIDWENLLFVLGKGLGK